MGQGRKEPPWQRKESQSPLVKSLAHEEGRKKARVVWNDVEPAVPDAEAM